MFIRVKANNEETLLKKGNYKITGRMIDIGRDSCTYMVYVDRSKSKNDSKDIIFEVAKIAKNNIWEVYDERIVLSFETRYKFQRKRKLERLQMIYDYLRNCRQAVSQ